MIVFKRVVVVTACNVWKEEETVAVTNAEQRKHYYRDYLDMLKSLKNSTFPVAEWSYFIKLLLISSAFWKGTCRTT